MWSLQLLFLLYAKISISSFQGKGSGIKGGSMAGLCKTTFAKPWKYDIILTKSPRKYFFWVLACPLILGYSLRDMNRIAHSGGAA
jgi:hypothetical protein